MWRMICDTWHETCDAWYVTRDTRHVTRDMYLKKPSDLSDDPLHRTDVEEHWDAKAEEVDDAQHL